MKFTEAGKQEKNQNLLIVDGLNIAFRWRYKKVPYYTNDYVNTVESLAKSYNCGNIIVLADGGSIYRKNLFPEYKANRKEKYKDQTDSEKKEFEVFMAEFANAFKRIEDKGHLVIRQGGLEADDLAAWIVGKRDTFNIDDIWLISSDKDWDLLYFGGFEIFPQVQGTTLTRYRVTMDVMVDTSACDSPKEWNWEDLLQLVDHEQMNEVFVEDLGDYTIL